MSTTFTIKQVPDVLAERLRRRAAANHRSLQRELLLILEETVEWARVSKPKPMGVREPSSPAYLPSSKSTRRRPVAAKAGQLSIDELWERARKLGVQNHAESTDLIRHDRDARHRR